LGKARGERPRVRRARPLQRAFPAYTDWADQLKALFRGYVDAKQKRAVLDYDDLLLYWRFLMDAEPIGRRFDHVLVMSIRTRIRFKPRSY